MITNEDGGYPNGIGHSGSETSEAAQGKVTGKRAIEVHEAVQATWNHGMTCKELQKSLSIGHGAASGALTRLHRAGHLVRLQESRSGQQVYVHPTYLDDRKESPYRPNIAYREGYKTPMALESKLTDENIVEAVELVQEAGATLGEAMAAVEWFSTLAKKYLG